MFTSVYPDESGNASETLEHYNNNNNNNNNIVYSEKVTHLVSKLIFHVAL